MNGRYVEMESQDRGEQEKNERRLELNRQHLAEWNTQLAQETQFRLALESQHRDEHERSYLEEINLYDQASLETRQRQAVNELVQQNRLTRINMLKRHKREGDALNEPLE